MSIYAAAAAWRGQRGPLQLFGLMRARARARFKRSDAANMLIFWAPLFCVISRGSPIFYLWIQLSFWGSSASFSLLFSASTPRAQWRSARARDDASACARKGTVASFLANECVSHFSLDNGQWNKKKNCPKLVPWFTTTTKQNNKDVWSVN